MKESKILGEEVSIADPSKKQSSSRTGDSSKYQEGLVKHHSLEVFLINKAACYLLTEGSKNTVLVQIFERDGAEITLDGYHPKTHTILLYKNPSRQAQGALERVKTDIVVIDPNNFAFSSHLKELNKNGKLGGINESVEIVTLHSKKLQIYKAAGSIGPEASQYRDCADVSVKLAFLFEYTKPEISFVIDAKTGTKTIDQNSLKELEEVKMVSNLTKIDSDIGMDSLILRTKQASDIKIMGAFYELEKLVSKNINALALLSKSEEKESDIKYTELLNKATDLNHTNTLRELQTLNSSITTSLVRCLEEDSQK